VEFGGGRDQTTLRLDQWKMGTSDELVAAKDDPAEVVGARIGLPTIWRIQQSVAERRDPSGYYCGSAHV